MRNINSDGLIIHDEDDSVIPYGDALLINDNFNKSKLTTTKIRLINDVVMAHINEFAKG